MPTSTSMKLPVQLKATASHHSDVSGNHDPRYPQSSSSYDSDTDSNPTLSFTTTVRLRASIATIPENRLREIMIKLVDRDANFQHAVARELLPPTVYTDTTSPSVRKKHRRSKRCLDAPVAPQRQCVNCGQYFKHDKLRHEEPECTFHPGRLEKEMYEFPSRTPEGRCFKVLRTITMWSCCDEDALSAGCVSAPAHIDSHGI